MQLNLTNIGNIVIRIAPYLVVLWLVSLLFAKCQNEITQKANVKALTSELKTYKLKNGKLVLSGEVLQYTNKQLKELVLEKDATMKEMSNKFSKTNTVTKIVNQVKIDTITITYRDTIPFEFDRQGSIETIDYSVNYKSNQEGIVLSDLIVPDTLRIVSGIKKKWFWGKGIKTIDVSNTNKSIIIKDVKHSEVKPKKDFWETTVFKIGIGVLGGIIITR